MRWRRASRPRWPICRARWRRQRRSSVMSKARSRICAASTRSTRTAARRSLPRTARKARRAGRDERGLAHTQARQPEVLDAKAPSHEGPRRCSGQASSACRHRPRKRAIRYAAVYLADFGGSPAPGSAAEFAELIADEIKKWAKLIKFAGIKPE